MVILSQKEGYHAAHADLTQKHIYEQASALEKVCYISLKSFLHVRYCLLFIDILKLTYIHCCAIFFYILGVAKSCIIS